MEKFKSISVKQGKVSIKILGATDEDDGARQLGYQNKGTPVNLIGSLQQLAPYPLIITEQMKPKGEPPIRGAEMIKNVTIYGVEFATEAETNIKLIQFDVCQKVNFAEWEYKSPWYPMKHDILKGLSVELDELYLAAATYLQDESRTMGLIIGKQLAMPLFEVDTKTGDTTIVDEGQPETPNIVLIKGTCSICKSFDGRMVVEKTGMCLECTADNILKNEPDKYKQFKG